MKDVAQNSLVSSFERLLRKRSNILGSEWNFNCLLMLLSATRIGNTLIFKSLINKCLFVNKNQVVVMKLGVLILKQQLCG